MRLERRTNPLASLALWGFVILGFIALEAVAIYAAYGEEIDSPAPAKAGLNCLIYFQFDDTDNNKAGNVCIKVDGAIEFSGDYKPDLAAKGFWDAVKRKKGRVNYG